MILGDVWKNPFLGVSFLVSRQVGDRVGRALKEKNNENSSFIEKRSKTLLCILRQQKILERGGIDGDMSIS